MHLAFEELNAITTHDDNLEKQYKESNKIYLPGIFNYILAAHINTAVDENVKLTMSLERARREIRVCTHEHMYQLLYVSFLCLPIAP